MSKIIAMLFTLGLYITGGILLYQVGGWKLPVAILLYLWASNIENFLKTK
jgi:hypothetical protein